MQIIQYQKDYAFYSIITDLIFFSSFTRGTVISLPQVRHFTLISDPVLKTSNFFPPHGCSFFISRIFPTSNFMIFIFTFPAYIPFLLYKRKCLLARTFSRRISTRMRFLKKNGSDFKPRNKNFIFVHSDVIIT